MFDFAGKKVVVLGAARSGLSCAAFLAGKGARVLVSDAKKDPDKRKELSFLAKKGVTVQTGGHPLSLLDKCDYLVISPGVSSDLPVIRLARKKNIPVLSEIEIAYLFISSPIIAITGTNGKTTTTSLIGEIFKQAGVKTLVCGNIGLPMTQIAPQAGANAVVVAEISSFQLENIVTFAPRVAVMLNITPDHLDRYPDFLSYKKAKIKIYQNQTPADFAVINYDDPLSRASAKNCPARVVYFSRRRVMSKGVFAQGGRIYSRLDGEKKEILRVRELGIPGPHNLENALAAIACAQIFGVGLKSLRPTLKSFHGVEHRLELVRVAGGVKYINDYKATNVDSVVKALESFSEKIVLIAGGRDKGSPYKPLAKLVKDKVKALILIGEATGKITKELGPFTEIYRARSLPEAVKLASGLAGRGEIVLLSPACASFDMFDNYEQRGRVFKSAVNKL